MEKISAKDIVVSVINASDANRFIKKHHYSSKVVPNSQIHLGAFLHGSLHGVMQFGPSLKKSDMVKTVSGTGWNEFVELNRMAFDDVLPRNSESRCISIGIRLIRKNAPHIKWIVSFADGTRCGDGTIYRASGFKLLSINKNSSTRIDPDTGKPMHSMQAHHQCRDRDFSNWKVLMGYQLKYIYFIDKSCEKKMAMHLLPFSAISDHGASMYKGKKRG